MTTGKKSSKLKKVIIALLLIGLVLGGAGTYFAWQYIWKTNVDLNGKKSEVFYIRTGDTYEDVVKNLYENGFIKDHGSFEYMAGQMNLKASIKPGKYRILARMSNRELINLLRAGLQEMVQVPLHNVRTKEQFVSRVCRRLEADSTEMLSLLNDEDYLKKNFGLDKETIMSMFIPDTYEFYWNTSSEQFLERMAKQYKAYWTDERRAKAKAMGLSQSEVSILASIVQGEQWRFNDEKEVIAGLYLNRIQQDMPLQSDPTLIFAIGDFTIQRVLNDDKKIDSPYNTYKHKGLPPGPILLPETSSLDAVLNYQKHDYIYMCAKEDFSGRHNFAKTYEQHKIYAKKYQAALNARGINR